ncbi:MAG: hypothetical protein II847_07975 [Ruminobacter sp.]|uniref:Uncharacterized protein n=1 Tax=Ruminobacter amylophilus TaxID=867 RepID=A0A662ZFJ7_9GAMM|nr:MULTISPECIES: hypothetical protein [Ruminobacter]MBQ3776051.1 hypothetical protein [Ruminobacter sp.]SFO97620.1 hypothetical protein SAMN02910344_00065 [Ruminobacter amylophilus]
MADDYENGSGNTENSLADDIVSMSSELGYIMHPNTDLPINRAEEKQKRSRDHAVYSIIAETIAYAIKLSEEGNRKS